MNKPKRKLLVRLGQAGHQTFVWVNRSDYHKAEKKGEAAKYLAGVPWDEGERAANQPSGA